MPLRDDDDRLEGAVRRLLVAFGDGADVDPEVVAEYVDALVDLDAFLVELTVENVVPTATSLPPPAELRVGCVEFGRRTEERRRAFEALGEGAKWSFAYGGAQHATPGRAAATGEVGARLLEVKRQFDRNLVRARRSVRLDRQRLNRLLVNRVRPARSARARRPRRRLVRFAPSRSPGSRDDDDPHDDHVVRGGLGGGP